MNFDDFLNGNIALDSFAASSGLSSGPHAPDTQEECDFAVTSMDLQLGMHILDAPCGNGRHALQLAQRGYRVCGIDLDPRPPHDATQAAPNARFECMDVRKAASLGTFDAVVSFYSFLGYFANSDEDEESMEALAATLVPGGLLLIGTANAAALTPGKETTLIDQAPWQFVREDDFDASRNVLHRRFRIYDADRQLQREITHQRRIYTPAELDGLLVRHGFSIVERASRYAASSFDPQCSRHQVLIARAHSVQRAPQSRIDRSVIESGAPDIGVAALTAMETKALDVVATRMRATLIEVLGEDVGSSMYSFEWLKDRAKSHIDGRLPGAIFVARLAHADDLAGHIIVREEPDADGPLGLVSTIYVQPELRHLGVASGLLRAAHAWFDGRSLTRWATDTSSTNTPLIDLFGRFGYSVTYRSDEKSMVRLSRAAPLPP